MRWTRAGSRPVEQRSLRGPRPRLTGDDVQQLARAEEELEVAGGRPRSWWPSVKVSYSRAPPGATAATSGREEGSVEVVGADHARELPTEEGNGPAVLQVGLDSLLKAGWSSEIGQP